MTKNWLLAHLSSEAEDLIDATRRVSSPVYQPRGDTGGGQARARRIWNSRRAANPWDLVNPESLHDKSPPPIILPTRQKAYGPGNPPSPIVPTSPTRSPGGSFETEVDAPSGDGETNRDFYNRPSFLTSSPGPNELPPPNPSWSTSRQGLYQTRLKTNKIDTQKEFYDKTSSINIIKEEAIKNISNKAQNLKMLSSTIHNLAENDPSIKDFPCTRLLNIINEIINESKKIKECVFEIEELHGFTLVKHEDD